MAMLSWDEAIKPPTEEAPTGEGLINWNTARGMTDFEVEAERGPSVLGAVREAAKGLGKGALAAADMFLGAPAGLAGWLQGTGTQLYALAKGETRQVQGSAAELAQELPSIPIPGTDLTIPLEVLKTPLQSALKIVSGEDPYDQSIVEHAIEAGSKAVEKYTGGALTEYDARRLVDGAMQMALVRAGPKMVKEVLSNVKVPESTKATIRSMSEVPLENPDPARYRPQYNAEGRLSGWEDVSKPISNKKLGVVTEKQVEAIFEKAKKAKDALPEDVQTVKDFFANALKNKGAIDPELLGLFGKFAGTFAAASGLVMLYNKFVKEPKDTPLEQKEEPQPSDTDSKGNPIYTAALGAAGAVGAMRIPGRGVWTKGAVETLARPLADKLGGASRAAAAAEGRTIPEAQTEAGAAWAKDRMTKWLNKEAGSPTDRLKDVEIPFGEGVARWEDLTDKAFVTTSIPKRLEMLKEGKAEIGEPIWDVAQPYSANGSLAGRIELQAITSYLSHVGDRLQSLMAEGKLTLEKLQQKDLVWAVQETAKWDKELAAKAAKSTAKLIGDAPVYKDYGDGMRWIQLNKPGQFAWNSERMGHSVRGYEPPRRPSTSYNRRSGEWPGSDDAIPKAHPDWIEASGDSGHPGYGLGGWEAIKRGDAKIYTLVDKKGEPHVTMEVKPEGVRDPDALEYPEGVTLEEMEADAAAEPASITQIKGKSNRAPAAQYLPYVQDFVKEGEWGEVGDLEGTGLVDVRNSRMGQRGPVEWTKAGMEQAEAKFGRFADPAAFLAFTETLGKGQRGSADLTTMAAIAAGLGGAALGAYLDPKNPITSALKGGVGGVGVVALLANARPRAWVAAIKRAQSPRPIVSITQFIADSTAAKKVAGRAIYQMQEKILRAVPDAARREAIYDYLERERVTVLTAAERQVADEVRSFYDSLGKLAKDAGVIREMLDDYATRFYGKPARGLLEGKQVGGMPTTSPFGKHRGYKTRAEAEAAGYTPVTTDIAQIIDIYGNSIVNAVENRRLINTLRASTLADSTPLITKQMKSPGGYVEISHPQMKNYVVHPDIAADLRFIFDSKNHGAIVGTLDAINTTQKRLAVSLSLFHAMALEHAMLGATSIFKAPVRGARIFAQSFAPAIFGENLAIKMIREGGAGDGVEYALKSGVQIGFERALPTIAEERMPLYQALDSTTKFLNNTIPGLGKVTTGALAALNRMFDRAMWGRFHSANKLETFLEKTSELSRNNARDIAAGRAQLKSREEIGKMAASFTNDIYGGLDWQALTGEFQSRWGHEIASAAFSPSGRLGMRLLMFAPDWTISTTRAFVKAFGPAGVTVGAGAVLGTQVDPEHKIIGGILGGLTGVGVAKMAGIKGTGGTGLRGLVRPTELADLHRQYVLRSALIYTSIVDTINVQLSGHHIWDNKDPTRLDLGDGRTMQVSKHFMEPIHWLVAPRQQALNKASFIIKEPLAQILDAEYLSTHGAPRMGDTPKAQDISLPTRVGHAARQFTPISAQGFEAANPEKAVASMLGAPIYGKTYAEKKALKKQRATQQRIKKRRKR